METILAYLAGRLGAGAVQELERHFEECPACQKTLLAQRLVWDALDSWKPAPVSQDFDRELFRRIEAEEARGSWWNRVFPAGLPLKPALALAGACVILVAALLLRTPGAPAVETAVKEPPVEIEQVEQVVEDLDMLFLLNPVLDAKEEHDPERNKEKGAGAAMAPLASPVLLRASDGPARARGKLRCG